MSAYEAFLAAKRPAVASVGRSVDPSGLHPALFPFQRDLVRWAVRKGRAAIFADTGLGKTAMQIEWAQKLGERTLVVAPLSVARQTVGIARSLLSVDVRYARSQADASDGITIANYEMLGRFDPAAFGAVVLDESSILKALDSKTRTKLTEMFAATPYRLCCTATPAPNDIAEIANHAEFLGVMSRVDMLATFFVHESNGKITDGWRLKRHAREPFFRWLASWGMSVRRPSDLGYADDGYDLPPLSIEPVFVASDWRPRGQLFAQGLKGIGERAQVRRATLEARVAQAAEIIRADGEQWIAWCGLNDEADKLAGLIPGAVNVAGSQSADEKAAAIEAFQDGRIRVLVTKARVAGFGLNLQNAHKMVFCGLGDSWESYYQCIRRCYRFGQAQPVEVRIVLSDAEDPIYRNVMRKEAEAQAMAEELVANVREFEREEMREAGVDWAYETRTVDGPGYRMMLGDCVERLAEVEDDSVGLSVFSPPFLALYTYTPTERDLGNCRTPDEFFDHFRYVIDHLLRVTMPGRNACVHVAQVPATMIHDGFIGLRDFRGRAVDEFVARGWVYHGEVCIDKDPQAQAIRTHSKGLLFVQLRKDSSWLRPALADYILVFRKPGENAEPIRPDLTNDEWIEWARPIWYGIRETDTLNAAVAKEDADERHVCPLQLGTIERCVRLWSNPGDLVLSPFAGIGSEGFVALKHGRRFAGIELKRSYFDAALRNLNAAPNVQLSLLGGAGR